MVAVSCWIPCACHVGAHESAVPHHPRAAHGATRQPGNWTVRQVIAGDESWNHNEFRNPLRSHPPGPGLLSDPGTATPRLQASARRLDGDEPASLLLLHPSGIPPSSIPFPSGWTDHWNLMVSVSCWIPCACHVGVRRSVPSLTTLARLMGLLDNLETGPSAR